MKRKSWTRLLAFSIFLLSAGIFAASCTNEKGGASNQFLSDIHAGYPDCMQSGCHKGYGAAGSVFNDFKGMSKAQGVQINMMQLPGNRIHSLPKTDGKGNFYTTAQISGNFMMYAGEVGVVRPSTTLHVFPQWKSCNRCHVPGGTSFSGYAPPTGTIKWRP